MSMTGKCKMTMMKSWWPLIVAVQILMMNATARADIEARYYGDLSIPFYLYEKSQVKIYLHNAFGREKILMGTFVLDEGPQKLKTLKNGIYSLDFSKPPVPTVAQKDLSPSELAELRLSNLMREVNKEQAIATSGQ